MLHERVCWDVSFAAWAVTAVMQIDHLCYTISSINNLDMSISHELLQNHGRMSLTVAWPAPHMLHHVLQLDLRSAQPFASILPDNAMLHNKA